MKAPNNAFYARSAATNVIIDLLRGCAEGNTVTYKAMITATNRDIYRRDRHLLTSALRVVTRFDKIVFGTIMTVGVQRMRPNELAAEGGRRIRIISRQAHRGGIIMDTATMERLTPNERLEHASMRGVLASIEDTARGIPPKPNPGGNKDPIVRLTG